LSASPSTRAEIPLVDLKAQYAAIRDGVDAAIQRVVERQVFINGPETAAFEDEFAIFSGLAEVVAVSNGTTALELALGALGVGPGDEVVTVSHTFFATAEAIARIGAVPVFVEVRADDWTIDPERVAAAVGPRTKAIVPVHLYGQPADTLALAAAAPGIPILEDAAQAHGARYHDEPVGTFAKAATFSFFPGKNLGAYGDAGAIATADGELAERLRSTRDHGRSGKYEHRSVGTNARIAELQSAVLRAKLPHLAGWNESRRRLSAQYENGLTGSGVRLAVRQPWALHARHLFVIAHPERDRIRAALAAEGIAAGVHYPIPCHLQPAFANVPWRAAGDLTLTEKLAASVLSLPLYPELPTVAVDRICALVRAELGT
jgi:dTDP-4-amino-4,6-dideoxygalactose transaminase